MINEYNLYCSEFNTENIMWLNAESELSIDEIIRLRNFLTSEIERVQKPVVDMLQKVNGNASPEIENIKL